MKDGNYVSGLIVKMPSALFATLLLLGIVWLQLNKFSIWNQIGKAEHFWTIFALAYAALLVVSG